LKPISKGSTGRGDVDFRAGPINGTATAKTPWFGTIRGRLGYAYERYLFYVTGGGLYGETKFDGNINTVGPFGSSTTYWTWTVGGGVEAHLWDRWSGKIEYLYAYMPDRVPGLPGGAVVSGHVNNHIVRVGLNYHF